MQELPQSSRQKRRRQVAQTCCVTYRVRHGDGSDHGATVAQTFGSLNGVRARRRIMGNAQIGQFRGGRAQIVLESAGQERSVGGIGHPLQHRGAKAMRETAA
jgi:hypothetical protein